MAVYKERLERVCKPYKTVVMLGDSMGATAALLFAPMATSVLAFCPQVQLSELKGHLSVRQYTRLAELNVCIAQHLRTITDSAAGSTASQCLQVDLNTSSIRPGKPPSWFDSLRNHTLHAVESAAARGVNVHVHCGSWLHDVDQVLGRAFMHAPPFPQGAPALALSPRRSVRRPVCCPKSMWTWMCMQWTRTAWHTTLTRIITP